MDVKASDILQSNGIIWVEGPSDRIYLKRWLELFTPNEYEEGKHYQFLYYGGRLLSQYNARFDRNHLPELRSFDWYDIMRLAAYRQYNPKIPATADCCSTGRMKRNYGVEPMLCLLSGNRTYSETHNAFHDALDELEIMRLLGHPLADYIPL